MDRVSRLTGLDALRGVAAVVVLIQHIVTTMHPGTPLNGFLAVDFFVMLSGYVMERTYGHRFEGIGAHRFLWRRFKRFWPVMTVGALLGLWVFSGDLVPFLMLLFFIPTLGSYFAFPLNLPAWSIFLELVANFLHGLRLPIEALLGASLLVMVAVGVSIDTWNVGPYGPTVLFGIPRVLVGYCIGILLYRRWRDSAPPVPLWVGIAALAVLLLPVDLHWTLEGLFVLLACPVIMAAGLTQGWRFGPMLGAISFPLYAWHYPIVVLGLRWLG